MKRIAVFAGSFDPVTLGHRDIVSRGAALFDEVIVALGVNTTKQYMFDQDTRLKWLELVFQDLANVRVMSYSGLTVDFCVQQKAGFILRGIRNGEDFAYEHSIASMNAKLDANIETVFLATRPEYAAIHSTIVREIIKNKGDVRAFIPKEVNFH